MGTMIAKINHLLFFSLKLEVRIIFMTVSSSGANKAPPVVSASLIHIMFPGTFLILLATFNVRELLHWPSVIDSVPDEGHIRSLMSVESLWSRDQRTVMLPWEPLDRRSGSSNLAVFCVSVTLMFPSKEKTENGQKCHLTSLISPISMPKIVLFLWLARMILLFVKW